MSVLQPESDSNEEVKCEKVQVYFLPSEPTATDFSGIRLTGSLPAFVPCIFELTPTCTCEHNSVSETSNAGPQFNAINHEKEWGAN